MTATLLTLMVLHWAVLVARGPTVLTPPTRSASECLTSAEAAAGGISHHTNPWIGTRQDVHWEIALRSY